MIRLHGVPMSRASRCLWLLEELGIPYENVPTSFAGDAQKPEYLELNPNGLAVATTFGGCDVSSQRNVSGWLARCGERPALRRVFPR